MASFLTDTAPSSRARVCPVHFLANAGDATGVPAAAIANLNTYLVSAGFDTLTAAGFRRRVMLWVYGNAAVGSEAILGNLPAAYPGSTAMTPIFNSPLDEVSHAALIGTSYLDQIVPALNTAGRKGSLTELIFYNGGVPAGAATDNATLDSYSAIAEAIGATPAYDAQAEMEFTTAMAPPTLAGTALKAWHSADALVYKVANTTLVTADNDTAEQWKDQSASGNNFVLIDGAPKYRTNVVNSRPVIRFDGASRMNLGAEVALASWTMVAVLKTSAASDVGLFSHSTLNRQVRLNRSGVAGTISVYDGTNEIVSAAGAFTNSSWFVLRLVGNGSNLRIYVNGTEVSYATATTTNAAMKLDSVGNLALNGSFYFTGDLASVAITNTALTTNQVQLIEAYMASRFALTVSGTPTNPHKAHVQRLAARGVKPWGESWGIIGNTEADGWLPLQGGEVALWGSTPASSRPDIAFNSPGSFYNRPTLVAAGNRAAVMILANGPSTTVRLNACLLWLQRGYDVWPDVWDFTAAQLTTLHAAESASRSNSGRNLYGFNRRTAMLGNRPR